VDDHFYCVGVMGIAAIPADQACASILPHPASILGKQALNRVGVVTLPGHPDLIRFEDDPLSAGPPNSDHSFKLAIASGHFQLAKFLA